MRVHRRSCRRVWFVIELVCNTIAIAIIKYRFRQLHVIRLVDLVVCVVERIDPPQWLYRFCAESYVKTRWNEVACVMIPRHCRELRLIVLPLLAIEKVCFDRQAEFLFDWKAQFFVQLELQANTHVENRSEGFSEEFSSQGIFFSFTLVGTVQQISYCFLKVFSFTIKSCRNRCKIIWLVVAIKRIDLGVVDHTAAAGKHVKVHTGFSFMKPDIVQGHYALDGEVVHFGFIVIKYVLWRQSCSLVDIRSPGGISFEAARPCVVQSFGKSDAGLTS